jgi:hypothetical protein
MPEQITIKIPPWLFHPTTTMISTVVGVLTTVGALACALSEHAAQFHKLFGNSGDNFVAALGLVGCVATVLAGAGRSYVTKVDQNDQDHGKMQDDAHNHI